jgi:hypothetical protein
MFDMRASCGLAEVPSPVTVDRQKLLMTCELANAQSINSELKDAKLTDLVGTRESHKRLEAPC